MATAFDTALGDASDVVTGYATTALPLIAGVAVAMLGLRWVKKIIRLF